MLTLRPVLLIIGLMLLVAAAFDIQAPRVKLLPLGLAFWLLAITIA